MQSNHFEVQKFDQKWLWFVLTLSVIAAILCSIFLDKSYIIGVIILIPVILLLLMMRLITNINDQGMTIRYFPIYISEKKIKWDEIENIYVRTYKPVFEFGGWGIRISFRNGLAFTTKGKYGIQIIFNNGKKLLIGTQKPYDAQEIIARYFPLKNTFCDE